jgi:hypothetical protein
MVSFLVKLNHINKNLNSETPDPNKLQLEPSSNYYYDSSTGFYYDPKTEYYYNSNTNHVCGDFLIDLAQYKENSFSGCFGHRNTILILIVKAETLN